MGDRYWNYGHVNSGYGYVQSPGQSTNSSMNSQTGMPLNRNVYLSSNLPQNSQSYGNSSLQNNPVIENPPMNSDYSRHENSSQYKNYGYGDSPSNWNRQDSERFHHSNQKYGTSYDFNNPVKPDQNLQIYPQSNSSYPPQNFQNQRQNLSLGHPFSKHHSDSGPKQSFNYSSSQPQNFGHSQDLYDTQSFYNDDIDQSYSHEQSGFHMNQEPGAQNSASTSYSKGNFPQPLSQPRKIGKKKLRREMKRQKELLKLERREHFNKRHFKLNGEKNSKRPHEQDNFSPKEDIQPNEKMVKFENVNNLQEEIEDSEAEMPLEEMYLPKQAEWEYNEGKRIILKICDYMSEANPLVKEFIDKQREIYNGLPCKIHDVARKEHHMDDCQRNKIDLFVGLDSLTKKPFVGFRNKKDLLPINDEIACILRAKDILPHIRRFEEFLSKSEIGVSIKKKIVNPNDSGWSQLSFRIGFRTNHVLMIASFRADRMTDKRIMKAKQELKQFYSSDINASKGITSLYFRLIRERGKNGPSLHSKHILGEEWIGEIIEGVNFKIRPQSDFPNNPWGAELINENVRKLGNLNKDSILIDVGSPLATVSLCVAKDCKQCHYVCPTFHGVSAENTFKYILKGSGIKNWSVSKAKIHKVLTSVVEKYNITTRSDALIYFSLGSCLRADGVYAINNNREISRLLLLTSDKKFMLKNFTDLAKPNMFHPDEAYVPVEAAPIHLFSHKNEMTVFILLEKLKIARRRLLEIPKVQALSCDRVTN